ncbi:unnamed protein product [Arabis nemorensis]|uniref:Uncharacterized protein n=1 Tax=Arabis nemorensis TaxID=586526 RepID=A0A565ATE0_9BRAS|nr:unnamed protein product [Arabis nemorensis]
MILFPMKAVQTWKQPSILIGCYVLLQSGLLIWFKELRMHNIGDQSRDGISVEELIPSGIGKLPSGGEDLMPN